jgi:hypothetical protein
MLNTCIYSISLSITITRPCPFAGPPRWPLISILWFLWTSWLGSWCTESHQRQNHWWFFANGNPLSPNILWDHHVPGLLSYSVVYMPVTKTEQCCNSCLNQPMLYQLPEPSIGSNQKYLPTSVACLIRCLSQTLAAICSLSILTWHNIATYITHNYGAIQLSTVLIHDSQVQWAARLPLLAADWPSAWRQTDGSGPAGPAITPVGVWI